MHRHRNLAIRIALFRHNETQIREAHILERAGGRTHVARRLGSDQHERDAIG